jgi:hypothetical protein
MVFTNGAAPAAHRRRRVANFKTSASLVGVGEPGERLRPVLRRRDIASVHSMVRVSLARRWSDSGRRGNFNAPSRWANWRH